MSEPLLFIYPVIGRLPLPQDALQAILNCINTCHQKNDDIVFLAFVAHGDCVMSYRGLQFQIHAQRCWQTAGHAFRVARVRVEWEASALIRFLLTGHRVTQYWKSNLRPVVQDDWTERGCGAADFSATGVGLAVTIFRRAWFFFA